jgi:multidrug resistance protein
LFPHRNTTPILLIPTDLTVFRNTTMLTSDTGRVNHGREQAAELPSNRDCAQQAALSKPEADEAAQDAQSTQKVPDPLVVDWDGPDDPANPRNWSDALKNVHVILVSTFVLYSNLAATMFAPGAPALIEEFHVTNSVLSILTVTIYVFGFALGPLFLAPLSELYGRLPLYHVSNVVYVAFTVGCALSNNIGTFLAFRFISGCAASVPMTVGGGTIADLVPEDKRGKAMAMYGIGPLLGPVIGPVVGGFVTQSIGWRWTFWLILILVSFLGVPSCSSFSSFFSSLSFFFFFFF